MADDLARTALVISLVSVGIAGLSLGWQIAQFLLTSARVRISASLGLVSEDGRHTVVGAPGQGELALKNAAPEEYSESVVALRIWNKGRIAVGITDAGVEYPDGSTYRNRSYRSNVSLPHRLEAQDVMNWYVPTKEVVAAVAGSRGLKSPISIRGVAYLGNGKRKRSRRVSVATSR